MRKSFTMIVLVLLILGLGVYVAQSFWVRRQQIADLTTSFPTPISNTPNTDLNSPLAQDSFQTQLISFTKLQTFTEQDIEAATLSFLKQAHFPKKVSQIVMYELIFEIQGKDKEWLPVKARVFIPQADTLSPIYVFGAGTTGLADICAPSLENVRISNIGNYTNHMIAQSALNYIVIFPEYEGFHNQQRVQPYFVKEMEAKVFLGALQHALAMKSNPVLKMMDKEHIFFAGYSQGGHAALSAAENFEWMDDTDAKLEGVIGYASAADVTGLLNDSPSLAPYLIHGYQEYYQEHYLLADMFQEKWLDTMPTIVNSLCVDQIYAYYPRNKDQIYTSQFKKAIEERKIEQVDPQLANRLLENFPISTNGVPVYLPQGNRDPIVTKETQQVTRRSLCQHNVPTLYQEFPTDHFQIRQYSFWQSNEWMTKLQAGSAPESNCP